MYCSGVVIRVEDFKYAWVGQELCLKQTGIHLDLILGWDIRVSEVEGFSDFC